MLFLHFLVRCLFSSALQLLFLCKAKIKYMSRRHCTCEQLPKTGNLSCCPPEILSNFCVHGAFLGGNMVHQKIESRRRKNNSRQQKIIDYLLKGMLEKLSHDKTTYVGVSMEGATRPHWGILPASTAKILSLSQVLIWICLFLQVQCIHIWSSYLILSS